MILLVEQIVNNDVIVDSEISAVRLTALALVCDASWY